MTTTHIRPKKTLIICVWMGSWPPYLPYFTKTASRNTTLNWLIISDQSEPSYLPENFEFQNFSINDLNSLLSELLKFPVNISDPRKLCDFKPAYGFLFSDFLREYGYWGYCDLDLVFGDLESVINPQIEMSTEIISFYKDYVSGPLCLFRNSEKTRNLFREIRDYQELLGDPQHFALDENNKKGMNDLADYSNFRSRFMYLLPGIFNLSVFKLNLAETRYRYQWYLKKQVCSLHPPNDMTDVAWSESGKGKLSISFEDRIKSDRAFLRNGKKKWNISWKNGKLWESQNEFPVFHFVDLKNRLDNFDICPDKVQGENSYEFYIDPQGFHT